MFTKNIFLNISVLIIRSALNGILANIEGVASTDGEITSVRGSRSEGQQVIIDGVRVRGSSSELQEVEVIYVPPVFTQDNTVSSIKLTGDDVRKTPGRSITAGMSQSMPPYWNRISIYEIYYP